MKLKDLISLKILCFFAYLNIVFSFCTLVLHDAFHYIFQDILQRKIYLTLENICDVYTVFLFIAYLLIIIAIAEFFYKKKINYKNTGSQNKNIYKKALSFISLFIFYIGLLYELFFIILYSFLYWWTVTA